MKSLILFTTTVLMMIQFTNSNILSDLANNINTGISNTLNSIRDSACVVSHRSDFDSCYDKVKDVYNGMGGNQDDQPNKDFCCSYLAYSNCVEMVSRKHCGQDAGRIADLLMESVKDGMGKCEEYKNVFDCMDPLIRIAALVVLVIVVLAILGCLIKICKSCCC